MGNSSGQVRAVALTAVTVLLAALVPVLSNLTPASAAGPQPELVASSSISLTYPDGTHKLFSSLTGDVISVQSNSPSFWWVDAQRGIDSASILIGGDHGDPPGVLTLGEHAVPAGPYPVVGEPSLQVNSQTPGGSFTVLSRTSNAIWFTFRLGTAARPTLTGEVRINQYDDPQLQALPANLAWPEVDPNDSIVREVRVVAGDAPVTVGDIDIAEGAPSFRVVGDDCGTLPARGSCRVQVAFEPTAAGVRNGVLRIEDSSARGVHTVALKGSGAPGTTSWELDSSKHEPLLDGEDVTLTPADVRFTMSGTASTGSYFWFEAEPDAGLPGDALHGAVNTLARPGEDLVVGTQVDFDQSLGMYPDPLFTSSWGSVSCARSTGHYTVHEVGYDEAGTVDTFDGSFHQVCLDEAGDPLPALDGRVRWRAGQTAPVPPPSGDSTAPAPTTGLHHQPSANYGSPVSTMELLWAEPTTPDWSVVVVRGAEGTTPPSSVTDGFDAYTGRRPWTTVTGLDPTKAYSFTIFVRDAAGNTSPGHSVVVPDGFAPSWVQPIWLSSNADSVTLTWNPPASYGATRVVVTQTEGYVGTPPAEGDPVVYDGTGTSVTVPRPASGGVDFVIQAFDGAGNGSATLDRDLQPTVTTLGSVNSPITTGGTVRLSARSAYAANPGLTFDSAPVTFESRTVNGSWVPIATRITNGISNLAVLDVKPTSYRQYRVVQSAFGLWSSSAVVTVEVRPRVALTANRYRLVRGQAVRLRTAVLPRHPGKPVRLLRLAGGKWRTVTRATLNAYGVAVFVTRPPVGEHRYRVVFDGDLDHEPGTSATRIIRVVR